MAVGHEDSWCRLKRIETIQKNRAAVRENGSVNESALDATSEEPQLLTAEKSNPEANTESKQNGEKTAQTNDEIEHANNDTDQISDPNEETTLNENKPQIQPPTILSQHSPAETLEDTVMGSYETLVERCLPVPSSVNKRKLPNEEHNNMNHPKVQVYESHQLSRTNENENTLTHSIDQT